MGCGQTFVWQRDAHGWTGAIGRRWVQLESCKTGIIARRAAPVSDWSWLKNYLQTNVCLDDIFAAFPDDDLHLKAAISACRGMRLLKQDHWECLASFILSSTKQITQIHQVVSLLRQRFGSRITVPDGFPTMSAFPTAEQIARLDEATLRECKMGFRAPYLLDAARRVVDGRLDLVRLESLSLDEARDGLMQVNGVGEKIAECVLLYGYGFPDAFPVDVWVARALRECYFRGRNVPLVKLRAFSAKYFGEQAGYAQQYLFHHIRTRGRARRNH